MDDDGDKPPGVDIEGADIIAFDPNARAKEPPLLTPPGTAAGSSRPPARFPYTDTLSLEGKVIPPRRWLVPSLIPMRSVTLFNGDGGTGKSLLAMQLQVAAGLGRKWLGYPVEAVRSLGLYAEDDGDEIHRRLSDILKSEDASFTDCGEALFSSRVGEENVLGMPNSDGQIRATLLYESLLGTALELGVQLVVLDTVADCFGGNENYRNEVRQFVNLLRRLAMEIDGAVVLTAHPSKGGLADGSGYSGSTAWNNTVRSRLYLTRPDRDPGAEAPDRTERILKTMKSNYSGAEDQITLKWVQGVFHDQSSGRLSTSIKKDQADRLFLAALEQLVRAGTNVGTNPQGHYAPRVMVGMPTTQRMSKNELELSMKRLLAGGVIANKPYGPPSRNRQRLEALTPQEREARRVEEQPQGHA
jgi:RecA-family ATPase